MFLINKIYFINQQPLAEQNFLYTCLVSYFIVLQPIFSLVDRLHVNVSVQFLHTLKSLEQDHYRSQPSSGEKIKHVGGLQWPAYSLFAKEHNQVNVV